MLDWCVAQFLFNHKICVQHNLFTVLAAVCLIYSNNFSRAILKQYTRTKFFPLILINIFLFFVFVEVSVIACDRDEWVQANHMIDTIFSEFSC